MGIIHISKLCFLILEIVKETPLTKIDALGTKLFLNLTGNLNSKTFDLSTFLSLISLATVST